MHTPGPWTLRRGRRHFHIGARAPGYGREVAVVRYTANADTGWTSEENARVVTAAPDLLEALRPLAALGLWEDNYPANSEEWREAHDLDSRLEVWVRPSQIRAARIAIAKAEEK